MRLPVERTNDADADLDDIWLRIATDNVVAADKVLARIEAAEDRLADYPEIGQARPDAAEGIRHWPIPPYLMLYRVSDEAVTIVRIVHGARDLKSLFDA